MPIKPETYARKFWAKMREADDGCLVWTGNLGNSGYGRVMHNGHRNKPAHRVAWELTYGPIPNGLFVCHSCDNPPCCNLAHLFLGTHLDNMADMRAKGRGRGPAAPGWRPHNAVITPELASTIREEYTVNQLSIPKLSIRHGFGVATIGRIISGRHTATDGTSVSRTASEAHLIAIEGKLGR